MRSDPRLESYGPLTEHLVGTSSDVLAKLLDRSPDGSARGRATDLVKRFSCIGGLVQRASRVDFYTTMQLLLRMADTMASAHSMENRSPFLDHRVMEFSARLPTRFKVTDTASKALLVDAARCVGVPEGVTSQVTKKGLFVPWAKWAGARSTSRGVWDRSGFAGMMKDAWRGTFFNW